MPDGDCPSVRDGSEVPLLYLCGMDTRGVQWMHVDVCGLVYKKSNKYGYYSSHLSLLNICVVGFICSDMGGSNMGD